MIRFLCCFLTTSILILINQLNSAQALVVYFVELPEPYSVFQWDPNENNVKKSSYKSSQFSKIKFDIPDEFVAKDPNGQINLTKTFENWRTGTGVGFKLPKTSNGVARFPFTIDNGNLDRRATQNVYYIGAQELLRNIEKYPDVQFGTSNPNEKLYAENLGLIEKMNQISNNTINCTGGRAEVAAWAAEKCLMCNCVNESLVNDLQGQVMIAQVVFRRVASKHFPLPGNKGKTKNNICGIISESSQFSWIGKPSKRQIPKNSAYMKNCKSNVNKAITLGPGVYDHFHVTNVTPAWKKQSKQQHPSSVGNHYFHRLQQTNSSELESLNQEFNASGGKQIFRPLDDIELSKSSKGSGTE